MDGEQSYSSVFQRWSKCDIVRVNSEMVFLFHSSKRSLALAIPAYDYPIELKCFLHPAPPKHLFQIFIPCAAHSCAFPAYAF